MAKSHKKISAKSKRKDVKKKHVVKGVQKKAARNKAAAAKAITEKVKEAMHKSKNQAPQTPQSVKRSESKGKSAIAQCGRSLNKPAIIGDEDFISPLPIDCLEAILTLLNHDDLDVLTSVSQTMLAATCYSRKRAAKIPAYNLSVTQCQVAPQKVEVAVVLKLPRLRGLGPQFRVFGLALDCSPANHTHKFQKKREHFSHPGRFIPSSEMAPSKISTVDRKIMDNLVPRLKRFSFSCYTFDSMVINDGFVNDFNGIGSQIAEDIKFENCALIKNLSDEAKFRFLSLLIAAKPSTLRLGFPRRDDVKVFNEDFIRSYAEAVEDPKLCIYGNENVVLTLNRDSLPALSLFSDLRTVSIVVEPEYLLNMIVARLDVDPNGGSWVLPVTGEFTDAMMARNDIEQYTELSAIVIAKTDKPNFRAVVTFFSRHIRIDVDVRFSELLDL